MIALADSEHRRAQELGEQSAQREVDDAEQQAIKRAACDLQHVHAAQAPRQYATIPCGLH